MTYLVTGSAGFIGMHICLRLLEQGYSVIGLDNLNDYYDRNLKLSRLSHLNRFSNFQFKQLDLIDRNGLQSLFDSGKIENVIHLAAQAGVRYSIIDPHTYVDSNLNGFLNILECCRHNEIRHLVYASSSSIYGLNSNLPFSEQHSADHPISLYAATKKSNELMAHSYSHLYNLPTTGLRFFTVYGPWGRPDMALFLFTEAILKNKPINVFNNGLMIRDFTYIDDVVDAVLKVSQKPALSNPAFDAKSTDLSTSSAPYRIFNVGNNRPIPLIDYIVALENALGKRALKNYMPIQPGDVLETAANIKSLNEWIGYQPTVSINEGIKKFTTWYREYYKV